MKTDKAEIFEHYWRLIGPGIPPVREFMFGECLKRRWKNDFAFPDYHLIVEIDGGQHAPGGGRHASDADRDKLNAASCLGWRVIRFSPDQLKKDPQRCIEIVKTALSLREVEDLFTLKKK